MGVVVVFVGGRGAPVVCIGFFCLKPFVNIHTEEKQAMLIPENGRHSGTLNVFVLLSALKSFFSLRQNEHVSKRTHQAFFAQVNPPPQKNKHFLRKKHQRTPTECKYQK